MKLMKNGVCIVWALMLLLALSACGKGNDMDRPEMTIDMIKNADGSTTTIKNGGEHYFFTVGEGEVYTVEMTFDNQAGEVDASITNTNMKDDPVYTGNNIPSSSFTVNIKDEGEYRIYYEVKDYIGEYWYSVNKK